MKGPKTESVDMCKTGNLKMRKLGNRDMWKSENTGKLKLCKCENPEI